MSNQQQKKSSVFSDELSFIGSPWFLKNHPVMFFVILCGRFSYPSFVNFTEDFVAWYGSMPIIFCNTPKKSS